ncbi:glycerophosphoryl diester phosphodiesterase [Bellilinea caldifistulae]|uniref:GP-PDE domain-containing protein n=1 Tax=Bellilinea caldifistulae TaxID=360411 RepID=A0A0N8GM38_9CHLR|nr:glycerophosphodiester phosphodiesterase family protein [Bellilinea caldifistulae]KPL74218.1 hypothetical protein AC812_12980 [Bellilinea caldifistulae]GAP10410.1 glycerophosphoryl diester phosphodiesterase [Bellilinea caldifistulae]
MNRLFELPKPIIFAHRGASAYAPENTMAAFRLAAQQGVEAIELDAKLSADGEVIVIHDKTVDRTTNAKGAVSQFSLRDFQQMDAGSYFSEEFRGESVPALRQVFEEFGRKLYINVELTNYATPRDPLPEKVAELVRLFHLEDWVLFSSFNPINLYRIRRLLPECPVGILALEGLAGWLARSFIGSWFAPHIVHPYLRDATKSFIQKQHDRHRRVHVWTVNDPLDIQRLFEDGADGIFTDDPVVAQQIRNRL